MTTSNREAAKPWLRSHALIAGALISPVALATSLLPAAPASAAQRTCRGTLLQIQVQERGTTRSDRFRFRLGLEAEARTKAAAMDLLNKRLDQTRLDVKALAIGQLTIPAPRSYTIGGGSAGPRRERASTSLSGEVSRANYDALIQLAGRLPGVRVHSMTSLASSTGSASLADQLLEQARAGRRRAKATARALGLRRVDLLRIDQRSGGYQPIAMAAQMGTRSFKPGEAPSPSQSVRLDLDYCLN